MVTMCLRIILGLQRNPLGISVYSKCQDRTSSLVIGSSSYSIYRITYLGSLDLENVPERSVQHPRYIPDSLSDFISRSRFLRNMQLVMQERILTVTWD